MEKITSEEIKKMNLKFIGFVTEDEASRLGSDFFCLFTKSKTDILGKVLGTGNRNVYVYQK